MKTAELDYHLPPDRIAQHPCHPRDAARLMVIDRRTGHITHRLFRDLPDYLRPGDCLVVNTTKVLPARFDLRRATGGKIEALFVHENSPGLWTMMLAGAGRLRPGEELELWHRLLAGVAKATPWRFTFVRHIDRGQCELRVAPPDDPQVILDRIGCAPLPPYIHRDGAATPQEANDDRAEYQTVYAREAGALAAPTAGMHFTEALLERIKSMGVRIAEVVLHVGLGTFQPVEVEDLADHPMHREWYCLGEDAAATIRRARQSGGRIIPVGTTSVRVLETVAQADSLCHKNQGIAVVAPAISRCDTDRPQLPGRKGWTNLLIQPPYELRCADALITNFHLPRSTLLALVYAFGGTELMRRAYLTAIENEYRFYSYGDAMLLH